MNATITNVSAIPAVTRDEAMSLAAVEYERTIEALRALTPDEWTRPTECPGWDVRAMSSHTLGFAEAHASRRELVHQMLSAWRSNRKLRGNFVDAWTAVQVRDRATASPAEIVQRLEVAAPASVRSRSRMSGFLRSRQMKVEMASGATERWKLAYLMDTIFTRDAWMHRGDTARATGRELVLTPEHDGRIVADAVAEWARRHGRPFRLVLGGPAGGEYVQGDGGDELRLDAVEFCRALSGRGEGVVPDHSDLLTQEVPF